MARRLEDKIVVITGAAGGIGRALAVRFAREGAQLALIDLAEDGLEETAQAVNGTSKGVITAVGDVSVKDDVDAFIGETMERHGHIDGLVNNAGRMAPRPIEDVSPKYWDEIMAVNARSHYLMIAAALPGLRKSSAPAIVNVASLGGLIGFGGVPTYCASKGAVMGLTHALAVDLSGDGIRVNAISPGSIDTAMPQATLSVVPEDQRAAVEQTFFARQLMKRYGRPEEVANVVLFLISDEASFLTGLNIPVDGGWTTW